MPVKRRAAAFCTRCRCAMEDPLTPMLVHYKNQAGWLQRSGLPFSFTEKLHQTHFKLNFLSFLIVSVAFFDNYFRIKIAHMKDSGRINVRRDSSE